MMSVEPVLVVNVLKIIFGPFLRKARSSLVKKLRDGDLNSQILGNLIVASLDDIKTKLDGLAGSVLKSSLSFTQEGLRSLAVLLPVQDDQTSASSSDSPHDVDSVLKLAKDISKMNIVSSDHFTAAMTSFTNANNEATKAFHNNALSIEDRILAATLRVQSRLLLSLETPRIATAPCLLYLEELHALPSLTNECRSYFKGGLLASFSKEKRCEIVLSVTAINFVVFTFLKSFTEGPVSLFTWPNLELEWKYHPLIPGEEILTELSNAGIKFPDLVVRENVHSIRELESVAVNKDGDLIVRPTMRSQPRGLFGELSKMPINEANVLSGVNFGLLRLFRLAIDKDDNVYLLTVPRKRITPSGSMVSPSCDLRALDSKGNLIEKFELGDFFSFKVMASTPDGFVVCFCEDRVTKVTFYKNDKGNIQCDSSFEIRIWEFSLCTVTDDYQMIAVGESGYHIRVYNKDGSLMKEFELRRGEHEFCVGITFNYLTKEMVVVSGFKDGYFLSTYFPKTGECCRCVKLPLIGEFDVDNEKKLLLVSNCSGAIALVTEKYILNLQ